MIFSLSVENEVDISRLQHLKSLNLTDVALASLDVSKNTELEQLCAEGLHMDMLDLRNNPKVSYLINAKDSFREIFLPEENRIDMVRWTDSVVTEFPIENLNPETLAGIDIQGTAIKKLDVSGYPNLEKWARQGVLLLNAVLTVRNGEAASHSKIGWEQFTDAVIRYISDNCEGVVFMLWGNFARSKRDLIDRSRHHVLEAAHPSPLARGAFFGCRHFSQANNILAARGLQPIDWQL